MCNVRCCTYSSLVAALCSRARHMVMIPQHAENKSRKSTCDATVGQDNPCSGSPYEPPVENMSRDNIARKTIRRSLCSGCVFGTAVLMVLVMNDWAVLKSFRMKVLAVDNPYEIGMSPWNAPLSLAIWLVFIAAATFFSYCFICFLSAAGICRRSC